MGAPRWTGVRLLVIVAAGALAPAGCTCGGDDDATPDARDVDAAGIDGDVVEPDGAPPDARPPGTLVADALGSPNDSLYEDLGPAAPTDPVRALLALPIRDEAALDAALLALYDPADPSFRDYLTPEEWNAAHAPAQADVDLVVAWAEAQGFTIARVASNRLLVEIQGTVGHFNAAFGVGLRRLDKVIGTSATVYGTDEELRILDAEVATRLAAVLSADLPADTSPLPGEAGTIETDPPPSIDTAYQPSRLARAYGVDVLHAAGHRGEGVTVGVVVASTFKFKDVQSFWQSLGITRADPVRRTLVPPISTRSSETTIVVEWAGALAPEATLHVYEGPDIRDTSLIYVFNEAVALGESDVLVHGVSHRESSAPAEIRWQYHRSAKMAAALGTTVVAPAGNATGTSVPASAWWVTSVGGTLLTSSAQGDVVFEEVWGSTGVGESYTIPTPPWQVALGVTARGQNDVAVNGGRAYWMYWLGEWSSARTGTQFAAAAFAGMIASLTEARAARGLPRPGALNPLLYGDAAVQASFRDVVEGFAGAAGAAVGWDFPSGWGAPRLDALDAALP